VPSGTAWRGPIGDLALAPSSKGGLAPLRRTRGASPKPLPEEAKACAGEEGSGHLFCEPASRDEHG